MTPSTIVQSSAPGHPEGAEVIATRGDDPLMRPVTLDRPAWALIEINNNCNLNCAMCNTHLAQRPRGHMTPALFERIVDQLQGLGIAHPGLHTVGETFLHPDLPGLMAIARARNYPVYLSTNAQFPGALGRLIEDFAGVIHKIRLSIDAATPQTYRAIRRGGNFGKVLASLEKVHRFNQRSTRPVDLHAGFVISQANVSEVGPFLDLVGRYTTPNNVRFFLIDGLSPSNAYFRETFPFPRLVRPNRPCRLVFRNVHFTFDGQLSLCCRDYDAEVVVGSLDQASVLDLWGSERAEDIRAMHRAEKPMSIRACAACHLPYRFVNRLADQYVHQLYGEGCGLDRVGPELWAMLEELDRVVEDAPARADLVRRRFAS